MAKVIAERKKIIIEERAWSTITTQFNQLVHRNCVILTAFDLTWCVYPHKPHSWNPLQFTHLNWVSQRKPTLLTIAHLAKTTLFSRNSCTGWPVTYDICKLEEKVTWSIQIPVGNGAEKSNHVECGCQSTLFQYDLILSSYHICSNPIPK